MLLRTSEHMIWCQGSWASWLQGAELTVKSSQKNNFSSCVNCYTYFFWWKENTWLESPTNIPWTKPCVFCLWDGRTSFFFRIGPRNHWAKKIDSYQMVLGQSRSEENLPYHPYPEIVFELSMLGKTSKLGDTLRTRNCRWVCLAPQECATTWKRRFSGAVSMDSCHRVPTLIVLWNDHPSASVCNFSCMKLECRGFRFMLGVARSSNQIAKSLGC